MPGATSDHRSDHRSDFRFARRPAWIAGHLLAVATVVTFAALGFWQLDRLSERQAQNELVAQRSEAEPVDVGQAIDVDATDEEVDELRFAAVTATGSYEGEPVVVRVNQDGISGARVFAPLTLDTGEQVLVLRGFVAQQPDGTIQPPPPPSGERSVAGLAIPISRLEPITRQALDDVADDLPVVVQAAHADDELIRVVPTPDLDEGPHLSYAVQWFLFAGVVAVGYPLLLRRRAGQADS